MTKDILFLDYAFNTIASYFCIAIASYIFYNEELRTDNVTSDHCASSGQST